MFRQIFTAVLTEINSRSKPVLLPTCWTAHNTACVSTQLHSYTGLEAATLQVPAIQVFVFPQFCSKASQVISFLQLTKFNALSLELEYHELKIILKEKKNLKKKESKTVGWLC